MIAKPLILRISDKGTHMGKDSFQKLAVFLALVQQTLGKDYPVGDIRSDAQAATRISDNIS